MAVRVLQWVKVPGNIIVLTVLHKLLKRRQVTWVLDPAVRMCMVLIKYSRCIAALLVQALSFLLIVVSIWLSWRVFRGPQRFPQGARGRLERHRLAVLPLTLNSRAKGNLGRLGTVMGSLLVSLVVLKKFTRLLTVQWSRPLSRLTISGVTRSTRW